MSGARGPFVQRLPVQHPERPHCPRCKRDLPNFGDVQLVGAPSALKGVKLHAVTFHIECPCGLRADMYKRSV